MLSLNTGNIIIGPKKSKQNIKQNNIQQKHKILLFMRIRFHFTYNSISWFPDQLLLPINWFISICDDLCHFPPPFNGHLHCCFLWGKRQREKKEKITSKHWKPDVTAFALTRQSSQRHSGTLSEMRAEMQEAPITLRRGASARAVSVVAF